MSVFYQKHYMTNKADLPYTFRVDFYNQSSQYLNGMTLAFSALYESINSDLFGFSQSKLNNSLYI